MKFIRKALLPTAIGALFLGFLGVVGTTPTATATISNTPGQICKIVGGSSASASTAPTLFIEEGQTAFYTAVVASGGPTTAFPTIDVDLNDFDGGDSDITSLNGVDISQSDFLNDVALLNAGNVCGTTAAELTATTLAANKALILAYITAGISRGEQCFGLAILPDPTGCSAPTSAANTQLPGDFPLTFIGNPVLSTNDNDIDCGNTTVLIDPCGIAANVIAAAVDALAANRTAGGTCAAALTAMQSAIINNWAAATNSTQVFIAAQFADFVNYNGPCANLPGAVPPGELDGYITVDVTCDDPGVFDLSFAVNGGGAHSIEVVCGSDAETAEIFANPTAVEINPSIANVAHSLVWVSIKGDNGEVAFPGTEVHFTTDRCSIEASTVMDEASFEAAEALFRRDLTPLNPATAAAVESSVFATTAPDGASRQQEETNSFKVTSSAASGLVERTVAAVILHCDPIHAPGVTPGPAVITAFIERGDSDIDDEDLDDDISDNDDLVVKTTVTVVGPPAANGVTVTAAPSTLACGEKATISVDVKDAAGQPVSDHTWVEAVTNAGGVLAGTGAVAGQQGLVSPVSSTVAETFGGKATLYLLTSTAHVGKYEVVITTGGGGGVTGQIGTTTNLLGGLFTTPPISVQVTIECTVPVVAAAPAPAASGPRTGQGITPPSTGDAGLASSDSSSWVVGAVVAVIAVLAVTGFSLMPVRKD